MLLKILALFHDDKIAVANKENHYRPITFYYM